MPGPLKTRIALEDDEQRRRCWSGIRSSSTRSLRRIRRTPPVSGSGRSFTRRSSMPTTASNGATHRSSFTTGPPRRVAPSGGHRCGVHGAGRPVPVPTAGAGCQLCGFAGGAERRLRGQRPSRRRRRSCATRIERGIAWGTEVAQAVLAWRATDGFSASYPPFTGGTAVGQWRPTPPAFGAMSAQGLAFTAMFVLVSNTQFRAWTTARSDQRHVHGRFQRRQGARSQDRIDAHRGPDGARPVLGGQRQRPLESGREPDCARQPPVHVRQQPASRGPEHRDGRHGVHHLERQAILRRRSERSDLAAGDLDPAGGHRRQSGHGCRSGLAAAHQHAVAPGIPCRAPQPQRRGCDRSPQPLPTTTDVYADDGRTAEPHVHQHRAGALGR